MGVVVSAASPRVARTVSLRDGVSSLRFVSGKRQEAIERLGIHRVRDLLLHLPKRYLDFSHVTKVAFADVGSDATVIGRVVGVKLKTPRPRLTIVEVSLADETGVLVASFFRQPWIQNTVHEGDVCALSGKVTFAYGFRQMKAPFLEVLGSGEDGSRCARVLPVHPVTEGVSASWMRRIIAAAVEDAADVCDPVPAALIADHGLMSLGRALRLVHFPTSVAEAESARRRLAYDELLTLQLTMRCRQKMELSGVSPFVHVIDGPCHQRLLEALPFALTDEQAQAADEVV